MLGLVFLGSCIGAIGQTIDSTGIAAFFSPQNLSQVNQQSKDSIYKLIGPNEKSRDIYHFYEAKLSLQTGNFDQALNLAKNRLINLPVNLPEFTKAKYYNIIGSVHANQQETKRAIIFFEKALRLSDEAGEYLYAAMMENNIANMYFSLVDYESAYNHVAKGYERMKEHPEHPFYSNLVAVLSISEAKVGKMAEAKEHGQIALKSAEEKGDLIAIIVANLALGEVANSEKKYEDAKGRLTASLELSEKYNQRPFIILNSIGLMVANLGTSDDFLAVEFGEKALSLVNEGGDRTTVYSIKKNLAAAYFGTNQFGRAYELMRESHETFRKINSIENKKAINDILLKYDSEKKQNALIASNNELLQKEIEQKNLILILGLLALLIIGLAFLIGYIHYRNKGRLALISSMQEKKVIQAIFEGEEIERERIARELHDGVASNLTALRYQLMANNRITQPDKIQLEKILLQAHEDTRRLSHNLAPISLEKFGFEKALDQFARENTREDCVVTSGLIPTGVSVPKDKAIIMFRVAQELTQNAIKHAEASEISIQIIVDEEMSLILEDDGKGFDFEQQKDSNGMASIAKRAFQLNGTFEVDSSQNHGTIAKFTIS